MTDQVTYLGVILEKSLIGKSIMRIRYAKLASIAYWQWWKTTVEKTLGLSLKVAVCLLSIYASEVKLILLYAKLDEIRVEKCSEKTLSLTADDVLENYWWYAF
jgi:hypothetical protein